ncbi:hypothetical protein ACFPOB_27685 [Bosea eneae]|uniref:Nitrile hydratase accessory protein n=1 Tax=Bosea eneae TaxID=151454 RepID=A0ABW0IYC2_9HYPH
MSDDWRAAAAELDRELVAVQHTAYGAFWPATAVALALIDSGVLDKAKLMEIIDDLHDVATAWAEPGYGEDATQQLEQMRQLLEGEAWASGQVRPLLRRLLNAEFLRAALRPKSPPPGHEESEKR